MFQDFSADQSTLPPASTTPRKEAIQVAGASAGCSEDCKPAETIERAASRVGPAPIQGACPSKWVLVPNWAPSWDVSSILACAAVSVLALCGAFDKTVDLSVIARFFAAVF